MLKEILSRKHLIFELVFKNLRVRYSRPILGFIWAFLSPLLIVAIFYIFFSLILKVKTKEAPFFLYLMSAVFPWSLFQDSLMSSATSLVDNRNLIREFNLPHYLVPFSIVLANSIIFLPSLCILIITALFVLKGLPVFILFLPVVFAIHLMITTGLSIIISILYVKYRDIKYMLETIMLLFFYSTPVFYSIDLVKSSFTPFLFKIYIYNPFVGICNLYRATLLKGFYNVIQKDTGSLSILVVPVFFAMGVFALGIFLYRKNKAKINDYLFY
jgi:lipopolysaccharide transport system permease protein